MEEEWLPPFWVFPSCWSFGTQKSSYYLWDKMQQPHTTHPDSALGLYQVLPYTDSQTCTCITSTHSTTPDQVWSQVWFASSSSCCSAGCSSTNGAWESSVADWLFQPQRFSKASTCGLHYTTMKKLERHFSGPHGMQLNGNTSSNS